MVVPFLIRWDGNKKILNEVYKQLLLQRVSSEYSQFGFSFAVEVLAGFLGFVHLDEQFQVAVLVLVVYLSD